MFLLVFKGDFMEFNLADENINLKYISNSDLLSRTENLVQTERKIMHLVLTHILEIIDRKLYAELGFNSMFSMMTKKYGYSEPSAIRRIDAAKLLRKIPEVADRLKSGALNLSQAVQLQKCLEIEAKNGDAVSESRTHEILDLLENCNSFETKQVLAQEFDMPLKIQEIVRPQKDESVRLEITFTKEQFEELKKAKSLLSHVAQSGSWVEVISMMAKKFNQSKLGKLKSENNSKPKKSTSVTEVRDIKSNNVSLPTPVLRRPYISVSLKRRIYSQAQGCCQYQSPDGNRCGSQFQVQIDHITPVAWGGETLLENMRLLCRTHNLLAAQQMRLQ